MRVSQYVYFAVRSETLPATEVTAALGLGPDSVLIRASRHRDPDQPKVHAWNVECRSPGMTVDEQVGEIYARLLPVLDRLVALRREHDVDTVLQVVRSFDDDVGEEEELSPPGSDYEKLGGQHQLLGWHLGRDVLDFLQLTGAELDVDEYG